ncbi:MAG: hypothetical protein ACO3IT_08515 [Ilumatobacteraceae bacterium]
MDIKNAILSSKTKRIQKVDVPEWGTPVFMRTMTAGERDAWELAWLDKQGKGGVANFRSVFLVKCLCDEDGTRLFSDGEVEQLAAQDSKVINRLFEIAREQNGLTTEQVDELAKN